MSKCKDWGIPHEHAHGTTSGWSYHGCRCTACREAHYTYHRGRDRQRAKTPGRKSWSRRYTRAKRAEGHPAYQNHGDLSAHSAESTKRYRVANRSRINTAARDKTRRLREDLRAQRRWWTPTDDRTVLRDDINLIEMAYLLGRTPSSIAQRRYRLRQGVQPRYYRSDIECMRGHSRAKYGRRTERQWICRECQRLAKNRYLEKLSETSVGAAP